MVFLPVFISEPWLVNLHGIGRLCLALPHHLSSGADDLFCRCDLGEVSWGLTAVAEAWWGMNVTLACQMAVP